MSKKPKDQKLPNLQREIFLHRLVNGKYGYVFIAAVGFLLYLPSLFFGFTYLDDNVLILDNIRYLQDWSNFLNIFKQEVFHILHFSAAYYRPILTLSFMIDAVFSGINPFLYHLSNIVYHIIASLLVFMLLKKLGYQKIHSFFFSFIFVIHPVLVQAVTWIPGRNDSLLAIFVLASFVFFIDFLRLQRTSKLLWHVIFFTAALFTKETALVLLPLIYLYVRLFTQEENKFSGMKILIKPALMWAFVILLWFLLRQNALKNPVPYTFSEAIKGIIENSPAAIQFIGKIFFPFNLSVLPLMQDTAFIYGFLGAIVLLMLVIFTKSKRLSFLFFGMAWFLAFLLPTFIRPNTQIAADFIEHRVYTSIVGLFVVLLETDLFKNFRLTHKKALVLLFMAPVILIIINLIHQQNFKDRLSFWQNAVLNSPHSPLAHRNLGVMLYFEGKTSEAEKEYRQALKLNPDEQMAHNNLGVIYMNGDRPEEAIKEYQEELKINPFYDDANFNLGLVYYRLNQKDEAVKLWQKTIQINPDYLDAYRTLAAYYQEMGDLQKMQIYLQKLNTQ